MAAEAPTSVLYINLNTKTAQVHERPEIFAPGLGGTHAAIRLLAEECPSGADPLGPDNPVIFAVGPLTCLFPLASKTVAMFKSPLTGDLGESHAGGRSAIAMRHAGFGAIVIQGASDRPIYLVIEGRKVHFRDASAIWGMTRGSTSATIVRGRESGAGLRTIMRIGRAGERLVRYASVTTETYRHFGRLGLGAVFGSKRLKAIQITGRTSISVADPQAYKAVYDEIYNAAVQSELMKKYHELGTAVNVSSLHEMGGLPACNVQGTQYPGAKVLFGEYLAQNYLGRRLACAHCPVACIHIAALRQPYTEEPYFYKTSMLSYDYELLYALGTMLGVKDTAGYLRLTEVVEDCGLDAISTGVVLGWATEALERGLISTKETGGLRLAWGDYDTYMQAVRLIVEQPNEFYQTLALGVHMAAERYGGEEFAMAFNGVEMAGYHTGVGAYVNYITGARHSHLDSAGYSFDQKATPEEQTPETLAAALLKEEQWRQVLASLVVCFFARGIYTPEVSLRALECAGVNLTEDQLHALGRTILAAKHRFKKREGFDWNTYALPKRIFETPALGHPITEAQVRATVASFAQLAAEAAEEGIDQ
ncbi:MAG: aldehyde ferredoxin oxidoreductase C-terminal domain-containing protein [Candidatus Zipacnadales bacterium]